jgi:hypothetical protein
MAEDLTASQPKAYVVKRSGSREGLQFQHHVSRWRGAWPGVFRKRLAHHQFGHPPHRHVRHWVGAERASIPHDRHPIGDLDDLVEPVGDVDDRHTVVGETTDDPEQDVDLRVGQDGRGLVEDEHFGLTGQCFGDRYLLLSGDG